MTSSKVRNSLSRAVQYLDRYFVPEFIGFLASVTLIFGVAMIAWLVWALHTGTQVDGVNFSPDFSCFYVVGTLLNDFDPRKLYDFTLQSEIYHRLLPAVPASQEIPFVNPPFFALVFKPLSLYTFSTAFAIWIVLSFVLFGAGHYLVYRSCFNFPSKNYLAALILAFTFSPFLVDNIFTGNSSAVGFFSIALAFFFEKRKLSFASGLALALCMYKPTMLVILLPMLLFTRRMKTLLGFTLGSIILFFLSLTVVGLSGVTDWVQAMFGFAEMSSGVRDVFRTEKYIDIMSFSRLLFGMQSHTSKIFAATVFTSILLYQLFSWTTRDPNDDVTRDLHWASAIIWTTVANLHFAIYDSIIVIIAILIISDVLYRRESQEPHTLSWSFRGLIALVYFSPLFTNISTSNANLQLFTVVLAIIGIYSHLLLSKKLRSMRECHVQ